MKAKDIYMKPEIEVIEVLTENTVMTGSGDNIEVSEESHSGRAGARQRGLWD